MNRQCRFAGILLGLYLLLLAGHSADARTIVQESEEPGMAFSVGVAWQGTSLMTERVLAGLVRTLSDQAPYIQLDIRAKLPDMAALEAALRDFETDRDAMVVLRSNGAQWVGDRNNRIPVFIGATNHPVSLGIASSLEDTDNGITGVTYSLPTDLRFETFRQILPDMSRVLLLVEKGHPGSVVDREETQRAAERVGYTVRTVACGTVGEVQAAVRNAQADEVIVLGVQALIMDNTGEILSAAGHRPVLSYSEQAVEQGALAGIVADDAKLGGQLATMLIRHLRDKVPIQDMPFQTDPEPRIRLNAGVMEQFSDEIPFTILELGRSQQLLESIYRSAPTGIGIVKSRVITQVNDYILALTGYAREELIGQSARIFYPTQEEFDYVGEEKYRQISLYGTGSVETRWQRKDGSIRHVMLSSTPLNPLDLEEGVTFTVQDITDRVIAQKELAVRTQWFILGLFLLVGGLLVALVRLVMTLRQKNAAQQRLHEKSQSVEQMNRELNATLSELSKINTDLDQARRLAEQASEAKGRFLANMSHEIRTPMNGMMGMIQMAQLHPSNEEQSACLDLALTSSRNLLRILNDILDYSKLDAGKGEVFVGPVDLKQLIQEVTDLFQSIVHDKQLSLRVQVPETLPADLLGDERKLRQVLTNLVGNAVKFTEKGAIRVTVSPLEANGQQPLWVSFSVLDTGIGISEEHLPHLFERFMQADDTYSKRFSGTGLGLAISKKLVECMGGTIEANSVPGRGSEFRFILPFRREESKAGLCTGSTA